MSGQTVGSPGSCPGTQTGSCPTAQPLPADCPPDCPGQKRAVDNAQPPPCNSVTGGWAVAGMDLGNQDQINAFQATIHRADKLREDTGWGLAGTWGLLRAGRLREANKRMGDIDRLWESMP